MVVSDPSLPSSSVDLGSNGSSRMGFHRVSKVSDTVCQWLLMLVIRCFVRVLIIAFRFPSPAIDR